MKRLLLATVLIAAPMLAHAADAPKIDPAKLSAHIKTLSSDAFEGRGPATAVPLCLQPAAQPFLYDFDFGFRLPLWLPRPLR